MDIVCKKIETSETMYINEITEEMDNHLTDDWKLIKNKYLRTYITPHPNNGIFAIRFPGATRGHIEVDENMIIQKIVLNEEICFEWNLYYTTLKDSIDKFLGMKLIFE